MGEGRGEGSSHPRDPVIRGFMFGLAGERGVDVGYCWGVNFGNEANADGKTRRRQNLLPEPQRLAVGAWRVSSGLW